MSWLDDAGQIGNSVLGAISGSLGVVGDTLENIIDTGISLGNKLTEGSQMVSHAADEYGNAKDKVNENKGSGEKALFFGVGGVIALVVLVVLVGGKK